MKSLFKKIVTIQFSTTNSDMLKNVGLCKKKKKKEKKPAQLLHAK